MKTKMTAVVIPGRICGSRMRVIAVRGARAEVHRGLELVPVEPLE